MRGQDGVRLATAREGGFTLLEILVVLMVFSLVMVALEQGVRAVTIAFELQRRSLGNRAELIAVDGLLRRLIDDAEPGWPQDDLVFSGRNGEFVLRGILPQSLGGKGDSMADFRFSVDANRRLILAWAPYRHVREARNDIHRAVLLNDIERIDCHYLTANGWKNEWFARGLPKLVKIRIIFPSGDERRWPDIVSAPHAWAIPG
ncbi:hypothetical protein AA101099_0732 [Neoasaia chiangmaiensis NBRC 101099]|uniref:Uncharacterized protein n=1 Tax=Neoasaia chiangmaiensis TaxID=320497 RepID=A0A1U9KM90_9PROT|nr:prepilin-type N-terminal cleavage/methylation domain-containing protein [Neoasaia chiangmaiensis]AQS86878.1 hypothetical protein A0U93_01730 [Neoasaia chiangmaiensis]GBR37461.1 hypothetical protein AA101099_0732 [Neoasaia chiangmaiensis NBRC 101099]GEN14963.1 hypothetical protein NCH01_13940 [Neoasaia chiangmaiensis]